ncbi:MAG TPA: hypothetical protein VK440_01605 [Burkholderiales bacterium]|nr:hypothetical protein [Burkholderiales bacterium]
MLKVCIKCGYQRKPEDTAPETECPHCGAIYAKVEAALRGEQTHYVPETEQDDDFWQLLRIEIEKWCQGRIWYGRALLLLWLAWIGIEHLRDPLYTSLFGGLNLGIHEAGHLVFRFDGEFLAVAGGTILQVAAPVAASVMFLRQPDFFALSVCGAWLATNFYNVATYIADARVMELPLVSIGGSGDVIHDWHYMLSHLHLLAWDTRLASLTRLIAFLAMWGSIAFGAWMLWKMAKSKPREPVAMD